MTGIFTNEGNSSTNIDMEAGTGDYYYTGIRGCTVVGINGVCRY